MFLQFVSFAMIVPARGDNEGRVSRNERSDFGWWPDYFYLLRPTCCTWRVSLPRETKAVWLTVFGELCGSGSEVETSFCETRGPTWCRRRDGRKVPTYFVACVALDRKQKRAIATCVASLVRADALHKRIEYTAYHRITGYSVERALTALINPANDPSDFCRAFSIARMRTFRRNRRCLPEPLY